MNVKAIAAAAALLLVGGAAGSILSSPAKTACVGQAIQGLASPRPVGAMVHGVLCATDRMYAMEHTLY